MRKTNLAIAAIISLVAIILSIYAIYAQSIEALILTGIVQLISIFIMDLNSSKDEFRSHMIIGSIIFWPMVMYWALIELEYFFAREEIAKKFKKN